MGNKGFSMSDQLTERLNELRAEYEAGKKSLAELISKEEDLQTTLLRISTAIQVLEDQLKKVETEGSGARSSSITAPKRKLTP